MPNPFIGFRPFTAADSQAYFGNDRQVEKLLSLLQHRQFVSIIGTPGAGKSSLIQAGLIPRLRQGVNGNAGREWAICHTRPGLSPIKNLAFAMGAPEVLEPGQKPTLELSRRIEALIR
jgi:energy-coupling factor transporter ATP-binding protein EcfA2